MQNYCHINHHRFTVTPYLTIGGPFQNGVVLYVLGEMSPRCCQARFQDVDDDFQHWPRAEYSPIAAENLQWVQNQVFLADFLRTGEVARLHVDDGVDGHGPELPGKHFVELKPESFVELCNKKGIPCCEVIK